jgi:hypothetical protein
MFTLRTKWQSEPMIESRGSLARKILAARAVEILEAKLAIARDEGRAECDMQIGQEMAATERLARVLAECR